MEAILGFFQESINLGAAIFLLVIIAILGKFLEMKLSHAIKSGLLVGIGFQGLVLAVNLLITTMQPVMDCYKVLGSGYDVLEAGFTALGAASWIVPSAVFTIPVIIIVNLILVCLKITKVLNVDIWNFMHFLVPGVLAYALSENAVIGFLVAAGCDIATLFFPQWLVPKRREFFGLEGTTYTTLALYAWVYSVTYGLNKITGLIPGLRDVDVNVNKPGKKLGIFGDPAVIGLLVDVSLVLLTRQDLGALPTIDMGIAASMVLIPGMISIMMKGLTPMGNAANDYIHRRIGDDADIYIGMDITLGSGDPACITCSATMILVTILLAFLIPDMRFFPLGILVEVCYLAPMCVLTSKGNIFRTLICMAVMMFTTLFLTSMFIPGATRMLSATGVKFEGLVAVSYFGWNLGNLLASLPHRLFGMLD